MKSSNNRYTARAAVAEVRLIHSLLIATMLLILSAGAALAATAGTVIGLSGECFVESAGVRTALALGAPIQIGDTVDVAADGKLKLRMADGSTIAVASGTRVAISAYAVSDSGQREAAQLSLGQGLLRAIVAPMAHPAKFEVKTAVGVSAARSTDWFIETMPEADEVTVVSGTVAVTSAATGRSVIVPPQRTTRLALGHDPLPPRISSRVALARIIDRAEVPAARAALSPPRAPARGDNAIRPRPGEPLQNHPPATGRVTPRPAQHRDERGRPALHPAQRREALPGHAEPHPLGGAAGRPEPHPTQHREVTAPGRAGQHQLRGAAGRPGPHPAQLREPTVPGAAERHPARGETR